MSRSSIALLGLLVSLSAAGEMAAQPPAAPLALPRPPAPPIAASPSPPSLVVFPIQLVLDDGGAEADVGVADASGTRQFLWFNRFASPGAFTLEEIWVLFGPGRSLAVGAAIDLVVYHDADGDPTNGATFLGSVSETVQVLDGSTFSVYSLAAPLAVPAGGDVLVGVVDRFVVSGVTPSVFPAALDTTASQGRSWLATWTGDPPSPPTLPSTGGMAVIDTLTAGNWLIRGFGNPIAAPAPPAIPAAGGRGLVLLGLLLGLAGLWVLRPPWLRTEKDRHC